MSNLLQEMKDAHGMEIGGGLQEAGKGGLSSAQKQDVDDMQSKLDKLK